MKIKVWNLGGEESKGWQQEQQRLYKRGRTAKCLGERVGVIYFPAEKQRYSLVFLFPCLLSLSLSIHFYLSASLNASILQIHCLSGKAPYHRPRPGRQSGGTRVADSSSSSSSSRDRSHGGESAQWLQIKKRRQPTCLKSELIG